MKAFTISINRLYFRLCLSLSHTLTMKKYKYKYKYNRKTEKNDTEQWGPLILGPLYSLKRETQRFFNVGYNHQYIYIRN